METEVLITIIIFFIVIWWMVYHYNTFPEGEYQTITEKISDKVWDNCSLYKTYQFCEDGKRCPGDTKMERPIYSTVCEDGSSKTQEFIRQSCGKNCTKTFTEEVTTTHKLNP